MTPAVFHILLVLAGGEAHGYAMMRELEGLTGSHHRIGPGTLYRSLFRLLKDGWIKEIPADDGQLEADERRRVYRITPAGLAAARAEAQRLKRLVLAASERGLLKTAKASGPRRRGAQP